MAKDQKFGIVGTGKYEKERKLFPINIELHIKPEFNPGDLDAIVRGVVKQEYGNDAEVVTYTLVLK